MSKQGIYTGFILPNQSSVPVQVWVPAFGEGRVLGVTRNPGYNTLNALGASELAVLRQVCKYYYPTQELGNSNYYYNDAKGGGTTEECMPKGDSREELPDLRKGSYTYTHKGRMQDRSFSWSNMWPAINNCVHSLLDWDGGYQPDAGVNSPTGQFFVPSRWTRVLVTFVDDGNTGVILRNFPWPDEYNDMIDKIKE